MNIFGYSPHLFFFILSFQCCAVNKNYRRLDSNHRSLLLKATTLPNCPHFGVLSFSSNVVVHLHNFSPPSCIHLQPFLQTFKFVLICNLFAQLFEPVNYLTIYHWYATAFFKNGPSSASFSFIFDSSNKHYNICEKCYDHPVNGAGIWTHNLRNASLLPLPLDHGSRPLPQPFILTYQLPHSVLWSILWMPYWSKTSRGVTYDCRAYIVFIWFALPILMALTIVEPRAASCALGWPLWPLRTLLYQLV